MYTNAIYIAKKHMWTLDHHESEGTYLFLSKSFSPRRSFVLNSLHFINSDRQSTKNKKTKTKDNQLFNGVQGDFFCFFFFLSKFLYIVSTIIGETRKVHTLISSKSCVRF